MIAKEQSDEKGRQAVERRVVILLADLAQTSVLTAEAGQLVVHDAIQTFLDRSTRFQAVFHGRIIKTLGDGFLAVFDEVADALAFAVALQQSLAEDPVVVAGRHLAVRIGLHLGTVVLSQTSYGEDIFGIDVNLAARLSSLARPGEILISHAARQALRGPEEAGLWTKEQVDVKGLGILEISRLTPAGVNAVHERK